MSVQLPLKIPEGEEDAAWLEAQIDTYVHAVVWISMFLAKRSQVGDMTAKEVLEEFEQNVCTYMRGGVDKASGH